MTERKHQSIIGKTISGVIARPKSNGEEIVVLQFDDGTCFELLSLPARRELRRLTRRKPPAEPVDQLTIFPLDGDTAAGPRPSLAA